MTFYRKNPILSSDSYKMCHFAQYPKGTERVASYITARGSKMGAIDGVVALGDTAFIADVLMTQITQTDIAVAESYCEAHGVPFHRAGWETIVNEYNGYLPLTIYAVPEGTVLPFSVPYVVIWNNGEPDERLGWVTSWVESQFLSYYWYMSTVATKSREIKRVISKYLHMTGNPLLLLYKLHDFGYRGAAPGAAHLGGMAHGVNFRGSDTLEALQAVNHYYPGNMTAQTLASMTSIPASEHSTTTSWGRDGEFAFYKNMVKTYGHQMFSVVIDSYDTMRALDMFCKVQPGETKTLYQMVKEMGGCAVMRPDSGDAVQMPVDVVAYLIDNLPDVVRNDKGYMVLPSYAAVIQGDGIDAPEVEAILKKLEYMGFSADNIAFGMGGGLLQKVNRDTLKFAMKAFEITIDGEQRSVVKDPITDSGKKSLDGFHMTYRLADGTYAAFKRDADIPYGAELAMEQVYFHNKGNIQPTIQTESFDNVRARAEIK